MTLIKTITTQVGDDVSREVEYQAKRGFRAVSIEMSPEAHEAVRMEVKAPRGARLQEHDGVPVIINPKLIGVRSWKINYTVPAPPTERMVDAKRLIW